jgi:hypothetical protein
VIFSDLRNGDYHIDYLAEEAVCVANLRQPIAKRTRYIYRPVRGPDHTVRTTMDMDRQPRMIERVYPFSEFAAWRADARVRTRD